MNDFFYGISLLLIMIWLFLLISVFIYGFYKRIIVNKTFKKYHNIHNSNNFTARELTREVLDLAGLKDIEIQSTTGSLTVHYTPKNKTIYLSENVFNSTNISDIGIATHEIGHIIQYNNKYSAFEKRAALLPYANIFTSFFFCLIASIILLSPIIPPIIPLIIITLGIIIFLFLTIFTLITLPIEYDANKRAKSILDESNILTSDELIKLDKVTSACAKDYLVKGFFGFSTYIN